MNPFIKKKKPAFGEEEPEEPESLDAPMQVEAEEPASEAPMSSKPPSYRPPKAPTMEEEPQPEMSEGDDTDYGAKLVADIQSIGEAHGMDPTTSRAYAADLFGAVAECLGRSAAGGGSEQMGAEPEGDY